MIFLCVFLTITQLGFAVDCIRFVLETVESVSMATNSCHRLIIMEKIVFSETTRCLYAHMNGTLHESCQSCIIGSKMADILHNVNHVSNLTLQTTDACETANSVSNASMTDSCRSRNIVKYGPYIMQWSLLKSMNGKHLGFYFKNTEKLCSKNALRALLQSRYSEALINMHIVLRTNENKYFKLT